MQSTVNTAGPSVSQPHLPSVTRPPVPNLAGAVEFNDVKALLKEWITTISGNLVISLLQLHSVCFYIGYHQFPH